MKNAKPVARIFKANVNTPYGHFVVAVETEREGAMQDARTAAMTELSCHAAQIKVLQVWENGDLSDFWPIRQRRSGDKTWAWMSR